MNISLVNSNKLHDIENEMYLLDRKKKNVDKKRATSRIVICGIDDWDKNRGVDINNNEEIIPVVWLKNFLPRIYIRKTDKPAKIIIIILATIDLIPKIKKNDANVIEKSGGWLASIPYKDSTRSWVAE